MEICVRKFEERDLEASLKIWNQVIGDGIAFPFLEELELEEGLQFFQEQTYTGVAEDIDFTSFTLITWAGVVTYRIPVMLF